MRGKTLLRTGKKLSIYSPRPKSHRIDYTVKGGDNPTRIAKRFAKRYGLKWREVLKKMQRLNRRRWKHVWKGKRRSVRWRLFPGDRLVLEIPGPAVPSKSTGKPQHGRLVNGEQLPQLAGYTVRNSKKSWGANKTIRLLTTVLPKVRKRWPKTPDLAVGDLSRQKGGFFPPHVSHQNGLDADIGYYVTKRPHPKYFKTATAKTLDTKRTWYLFKLFLDTNEVDLIFVDYGLQRPLYHYAKHNWPLGKSKRARRKARKERDAFLKRHFQYPRGRRTSRGTIRESKGHKNHFHIRFMPTE